MKLWDYQMEWHINIHTKCSHDMPGEDRDDLWSNQGPLELPPWFEGQAGEGKPNHHGMCGAPQYCNNS